MNRVDWYGPDTRSWNPLAECCTRVGEGCRNCWHLRMAARLVKNPAIPKAERDAYAGGAVVLRERELAAPLRLRKPALIAVQFMGDLFHPSVPSGHRRRVWQTMTNATQHTFLVLTKRPEVAWHWLMETWARDPAPNVILGISASTQPEFDRYWACLSICPAAGRWASLEPLVEAIRLGQHLERPRRRIFSGGCVHGSERCDCHFEDVSSLDWVVVGGESGPGARPMHPNWARSIRDECVAAKVPFNFKQWGEWIPHRPGEPDYILNYGACAGHDFGDGWIATRIGRSRSGRVLDGRTWDGLPAGIAGAATKTGDTE